MNNPQPASDPLRPQRTIRRTKGWRVLALLAGFVAVTSVNWTPDRVLAFRVSDESAFSHHGTKIVPLLTSPVADNVNVLWCETFQLAWNQACQSIHGPIGLVPGSPVADALNQRSSVKPSIDDASCYAIAGAVRNGVLDRVQEQTKARGKSSHFLSSYIPLPGDFLCYARLDKALTFLEPFGKLGSWPIEGGKIPCFGFLHDQHSDSAQRMRRQVLVHHYGNKEDFVVELKTKESGDRFILAKLPMMGTLAAMAKMTQGRLQDSPPEAGPSDMVVIPHVTCNESASFAELEGRHLRNAPDLVLRKAAEVIDFRMDEKGVALHSEATVAFGCSAEAPPGRVIVLSPPFLLLMKRREAAEPYLVCWIANADLLKER